MPRLAPFSQVDRTRGARSAPSAPAVRGARRRHDAASLLKSEGEVLSFGSRMHRISWILRGSLSAALMMAGSAMVVPTARAGEADDLQSMIDRARQGASDLERLDERAATREEITLLRVWLDEAWRLRSEQKYDEVR